MASWTDVYDGKYVNSEDDFITINKIVVEARADEGSYIPQIDEKAMKYLLEHNFQVMRVDCDRRIRVVEREGGNQFACSWQGQPESKVVKTVQIDKETTR